LSEEKDFSEREVIESEEKGKFGAQSLSGREKEKGEGFRVVNGSERKKIKKGENEGTAERQ
jgi:hypothetical protein